MLDVQVIQNSRDDKIDHVVDRLGFVVKTGRSWKNRSAGLARFEHVFDLNQ